MRKNTLEQMQKIAKSRQGECLSDNYVYAFTKLKWKCKKGHIWEARPNDVKRGNWCPYCAHHIKLTIEEMQELAKSRGGKCLSNKYLDIDTKLKWQCREGHTWEAIPYSIKRGSWCPYCSHNIKHTIEDMQKLAKLKGRECLSNLYVNSNSKLKWQCKEGHIWEAFPENIKQGKSWCPYCSHKAKLTIGEMQKLAKSRGGECLSELYVNAFTKLKWQCKEGHIWEAVPHSITNHKHSTWCPYCSHRVKLTIGEMQEIAKSRGGKCLSKRYVNSSSKLKWQCKEDHIWEAVPGSIKYGNWCPQCAHKAPWNKGKTGIFSEETIKKMSETRKRLFSEGKITSPMKGKHFSLDGGYKKNE